MLGEKLRSVRESQQERQGRKIYQRDAARICGIKEETYRSYEYGRSQLPEKCAKALAAEWGLNWHDFYAVPRKRQPSIVLDTRDAGPPTAPAEVLDVPLPYIGYIAASSKVDWTDPLDADVFEYVPAEMAARGRFACRVQGDSCYPWLWQDDVCVWQYSEAPRLGSIVVHRSHDNRATMKQLKHDGERYFLHPGNPRYEDEFADGAVLGYLVGLIRNMGGMKITIYKDGDPILPSNLSFFAPPA